MSALKARREALGLSLRDVEEITQGRISNSYLSQLENGQIKSPSLGRILELSAALAVKVEEVAAWLSLPTETKITPVCPTCGQALFARLNQEPTHVR